MMHTQAIIIGALVGGFVPHLIGIYNASLMAKDQRPDFKDIFYWLKIPAGAALGALVVFTTGSEHMTIQNSIYSGLSAPYIVQSWIQSKSGSDVNPTEVD